MACFLKWLNHLDFHAMLNGQWIKICFFYINRQVNDENVQGSSKHEKSAQTQQWIQPQPHDHQVWTLRGKFTRILRTSPSAKPLRLELAKRISYKFLTLNTVKIWDNTMFVQPCSYFPNFICTWTAHITSKLNFEKNSFRRYYHYNIMYIICIIPGASSALSLASVHRKQEPLDIVSESIEADHRHAPESPAQSWDWRVSSLGSCSSRTGLQLEKTEMQRLARGQSIKMANWTYCLNQPKTATDPLRCSVPCPVPCFVNASTTLWEAPPSPNLSPAPCSLATSRGDRGQKGCGNHRHCQMHDTNVYYRYRCIYIYMMCAKYMHS